MAITYEESANTRKGASLSAEAQHNFGRDGIVAPEVSGSIKKRRKDRQT